MKTAFRSIRRRGVYSLINITGLAVGVAAAILIFMWVRNELSYDSYHKNADRIYMVTNIINANSDEPWVWESSPYPLVKLLRTDVPEIEDVAAVATHGVNSIKIGDKLYSVSESATYVDQNWLEMFGYKVIDGSIAGFDSNASGIVLTESEAKKYFGTAAAVGQTISIDKKGYTVQAVVRDYPSNSSFRRGFLLPTNALLSDSSYRADLERWSYYNHIAFVKLRENADTAAVNKKICGITSANNKEGNNPSRLKALKDVHFDNEQDSWLFLRGNKRTVAIFSILGLLLLFTACINYVNLTTAKANLRAKEVGVKKIVGASRMSLFMQFVAESFIVSLIAIAAALAVIPLLSSWLGALLDNVDISYSSPVIWMISAGVLLVTTLLNGVYPALMLSSFNPMNSLKGMSMRKVKDGALRKALVVFQFALSAALIVCVLVIYRQMRYVQTMNPGYDREQVVMLDTPWRTLFGDYQPGYEDRGEATVESVKHEMRSIPGIAGISLNGGNLVDVNSTVKQSADWAGRDQDFNPAIKIFSADADYMNLVGLQMVEGRWFEAGNKADATNVILNETAVREMKIPEPHIGQRFDLMGMKGQLIGVVKDFHYKSLHEPIGILAIHNSNNYNISLKVLPGKSAQVLEAAKGVWEKFFPNDPFAYTFMDDAFNSLYKADARASQLMLISSILAIFIAVLGLLGLAAFAVERRTKEIGIRKVLGASVASIAGLLSKEFMILVSAAFLIAAPVAWLVMNKWLENFAYRIGITVWFFVAGAAITLLMAMLAVGWQAVRAAGANPVNAIKTE